MKKQALNPYLPEWEYVPDGEPRVFGNRLYLYGSHDKFEGDNYCLNSYVGWSAPLDDLGNWETNGIVYPKEADLFKAFKLTLNKFKNNNSPSTKDT